MQNTRQQCSHLKHQSNTQKNNAENKKNDLRQIFSRLSTIQNTQSNPKFTKFFQQKADLKDDYLSIGDRASLNLYQKTKNQLTQTKKATKNGLSNQKWVHNNFLMDKFIASQAIPLNQITLDLDQAVTEIKDDYFTCCVCSFVVKNPKACNTCNNIMCEDCLNKWHQNKKSCPNCRSDWKEGIITQMRLKQLHQLEFFCPNCDEIHTYNQMLEHLQICRDYHECLKCQEQFEIPLSLNSYKEHLKTQCSQDFLTCNKCDAPFIEEKQNHNCALYLETQKIKRSITQVQNSKKKDIMEQQVITIPFFHACALTMREESNNFIQSACDMRKTPTGCKNKCTGFQHKQKVNRFIY